MEVSLLNNGVLNITSEIITQPVCIIRPPILGPVPCQISEEIIASPAARNPFLYWSVTAEENLLLRSWYEKTEGAERNCVIPAKAIIIEIIIKVGLVSFNAI
jgi:hypothetical protein